MNENNRGLLRPNETCWRRNPASRVRFLVDGEEYFRAFRAATRKARQSILILGWDIHSRFDLLRGKSGDGLPSRLDRYLDALAQRCEGLRIHLLNWDYSLLLAPDREWGGEVRFGWNTGERVCFRSDAFHPVGASHHQKVVVVDDRVAFVGGLDFTRGRWDSRAHRAEDKRRRDTAGSDIPQPYHDFEMMVAGEIAADLGDLARERWLLATGERLEAPEGDAATASWPDGHPPHMQDVESGIARTLPQYEHQAERREIQASMVAMIEAARERIFIENQYFTAPLICQALARRLDEDDGPEVVVLLPRATDGWLSQTTMDVLRERRIRELQRADRHGRLGVYYPHQEGLGDACINLHSKILIVDDRFMSAGSANLNNRSMGLDSECNLLFDAADQPQQRAALAALRHDLLAEHLDVQPDAVERALEREGSLLAAIETLAGTGRSLRPLPLEVSPELDALVPATEITDPEQPIDRDYLADRLDIRKNASSFSGGLWRVAALVLGALALAAAWRWTPLAEWLDPDRLAQYASGLQAGWGALLLTVGAFVVGGFLMVPVTLLIVVTGVVFGSAWGFAYALLGAELSALASYAAGQAVGQEAMRNLSGRWISRASEALGRQGLLAVITLRIVPVAPFTVVNLAAGASHIRWRDFAIGTALGLVPGILALVVLSDRLMAAIRSPSAQELALAGGLFVTLGLGLWAVRRWARRQQDGGAA